MRTAASGRETALFQGPVEVDETYMGGQRKNMPKAKRAKLEGRGTVGKTAIVGAKDRATNAVSAKVVQDTDAKTLQGFVADHATPGATSTQTMPQPTRACPLITKAYAIASASMLMAWPY